MAIVSSGGASPFPGGRTGDLRGGAAPRTQVEVLASFSMMGIGSEAGGGEGVPPSPLVSRPASSISSCVRTIEELYELDVSLSVGELNKS